MLEDQIIQVVEPAFALKFIHNWYSELNFMAALEHLHYEQSTLELEPCP